MAETPRYRATPVPGFLSTAQQIPRSIWRTVKVGGIRLRDLARRAGQWLKLKTARPVLATDRGVRRGGRGLWKIISATPTFLYRGLGYVARSVSFLFREALAGFAIVGLIAALVGMGFVKATETYDSKVHDNAKAWSQGERIPLKPMSEFYDTKPDADAPDYHGDDEASEVQEEADKVVEELSKNTGLNEDQIKDALKALVKGETSKEKLVLNPPAPGQFTKEDYPIIEREIEVEGVKVWQEMRYDEVDTAIRDHEGRKELYVALSQMTDEQVSQRWLMMKERARFLGDFDRGSYYFGRELAVGQYQRMNPNEVERMSPQAMADFLATNFSNPNLAVPMQINEQQLRLGAKHEWARVRDAKRAEATRRNAAQKKQRESTD
jgi:hypothetical protein